MGILWGPESLSHCPLLSRTGKGETQGERREGKYWGDGWNGVQELQRGWAGPWAESDFLHSGPHQAACCRGRGGALVPLQYPPPTQTAGLLLLRLAPSSKKPSMLPDRRSPCSGLSWHPGLPLSVHHLRLTDEMIIRKAVSRLPW